MAPAPWALGAAGIVPGYLGGLRCGLQPAKIRDALVRIKIQPSLCETFREAAKEHIICLAGLSGRVAIKGLGQRSWSATCEGHLPCRASAGVTFG